MEQINEIVAWVLLNYQIVLSAILAILGGLITIFMLIPGEQPEKALQGLVDFLTKFSRK